MSQHWGKFSHSFRVRWSETDAQGVVFNARYLDYADIAITEYWRAIGFRTLYPDTPFECHVARATVNFRRPIRPDEWITVTACTEAIGRSSMTQKVSIYGSGGLEDHRADVELVSVHVDLATHRPAPLPHWASTLLTDFDRQEAKRQPD
jgi:acyl-CoA thioester hydrolase